MSTKPGEVHTSIKVVYETCVIQVDVQALFLSLSAGFNFGAAAASSSRAVM